MIASSGSVLAGVNSNVGTILCVVNMEVRMLIYQFINKYGDVATIST